MSERGLVVHQEALSAMEAALTTATETITRQIEDLLQQVEALTPGWEEGSESHAAQLAHQQKLRDGVERLTAALDGVRAKVATHRESARETEVENVAIVGG
ncbi:MAG: hypothetical protein AVDCRST_MAG32-204 [uncultured Nocardioides sp.]|uniref:ESAT-6-like protein n=1 Tax=uncultured Nocardioides sp. TaxID=198441 RepID=A0A6J4MSA7_9ACTN|nr:MAG: hypothetical protein AVDCRST_MAG32-204 [uncultured Nocardioides sp.]